MKVSVLQENLKLSLVNAIKAIPARPQLQILNSFLLTATDTHLEVSATDLYVGIRTKVMGDIQEPGTLAVPAKTFLDMIQSLPAGKIDLHTQDTTLTLISSSGKVKLQTQPSDEYPAFPAQAGQSLVFSLQDLELIDQYVRFATSTDQTRLILTSLLMKFGEKGLEVVGTDGFRLAHLVLPSTEISGESKFLLPAKAVSEVVRIARQENVASVTFFISHELKQLSFMINQTEMFIRLLEGEFPPYEKIMPAEFELQASWDGEEFTSQIKRAFIFARETSNIVRAQLEDGKLKISARSATQGEYEGEMPIKLIKGNPNSIAFNAKYLLDFLSQVKPSTIWFGMNDSLKPALLRPEGMSHYTYIVMPFRVNE
jgi:DNA polymerase-3 subunit beta